MFFTTLVLQDQPHRDTSFSYFFKFLRVLSPQNACSIFCYLYMPTFVGKIFQFMVSHSQKITESMLFHSWPSPLPPHSKLLVEFFENVSPTTEGVEEAMICYVKIQSENMQMTWNISLFPFDMIAIFLNVVALKFCK